MTTKYMTIEQVIARWLENQPTWYSPALHIALCGEPTAEEVDQLTIAACKEQGVELGDIQPLTPYQPGDLARVGISSREVLLKSVNAVTGINALIPDAKLTFATQGLTVVYGTNGTGKSGFSRLIRNAGTSRAGSMRILPNVFEESIPSSAEIELLVDGNPQVLKWNQGDTSYPAVPEVAFFDAACAAIEVGDKASEMLYTPRIIQALMRLTRLVTDVANVIQARADAVSSTISRLPAPTEISNQALIFTALNCKTRSEAEKLVLQAPLTEQEQVRLVELPRLIASDPSKELPKYQYRKSQLSNMRSNLVALYERTTDQFMQSYTDALATKKVADDAAVAARKLVSDNSNLDGIGSDAWKALWLAARDYSVNVAYPASSFPPSIPGTLCPLCQQPLDGAAINRLSTFEKYVSGAAESAVAETQKTVDTIIQSFMSAVQQVKHGEGAIGILETDEARNAMGGLITRLSSVTSIMDQATMTEIAVLTTKAGQHVRGEINTLEAKIKTANESLDPGKAKALADEHTSLSCRAWVASMQEQIVSNASSRELQNRLLAVKAKINTRAVSNLVSSVSQIEIVERMEAAFTAELDLLGASSQRVVIDARARLGREVQRIALDGTQASTTDVLSEGEQKIVALAAYFALIDVLPGKSTAVLDDPITSLDHLWRRSVAKRIVDEAGSRPVVVFTHEPVFCSQLAALAKEAGVSIEYRTVYKRGTSTGVVRDGLDWDASNVRQRISALHKEVTNLRQRSKSGDFTADADLVDALRHCYSKLRSTWERAVEEVLLDGVVERMEPPVHTKKLKSLLKITAEDVNTVEAAMTKCSRLTEAHDDPNVTPDACPTIDEFEADVNALKSWVKEVRNRRS